MVYIQTHTFLVLPLTLFDSFILILKENKLTDTGNGGSKCNDILNLFHFFSKYLCGNGKSRMFIICPRLVTELLLLIDY